MKIVSDEALIDLDDTVMLLPNENKPDVTECFERVRHLIEASVDLRLVSGTGRVYYLIVVTTATCSPGWHPSPSAVDIVIWSLPVRKRTLCR